MLRKQDFADKEKDKFLVNNNMESDTEEVFYKGQTYKKTSQNLKNGFGIARNKKPSTNNKLDENGIDVGGFQEYFHTKGKTVQDNTDEYEEPRKPDYDVFQIVEE